MVEKGEKMATANNLNVIDMGDERELEALREHSELAVSSEKGGEMCDIKSLRWEEIAT